MPRCVLKARAMDENCDLKTTHVDPASGEPADDGRLVRRRVRFPLVECAHAARPDEEITPERLAEILLAEEVGWLASGSG
jgi:hypothetical protein